jgi:LuxR family maltose regulon positive regulatory protein
VRARDGSFGARFAEAVLSGLRGDHQRAVAILTQLLPTTVDAPATVGLATAVARVAFLQRVGTATSVQAARDLVPDLLSRAEPQRLLGQLAFGGLLSSGFVDLVIENAESPDPHPFAHDAAKGLSAVARTYRAPGKVPDLAPEEPRELLTTRELEVLEQLALGGGNADLARALFVSENTVKTHLASIYRKLDVDRRADALRVARDLGLI